jgi:hypothetical protein
MSYDTPADQSSFPDPPTHDALSQATVSQQSTLDACLSPLRAWRERRLALHCCRQLVAIHDRLAHQRPWLCGRVLYLHVVAESFQGDFELAERMLRAAEHSYTIWPTDRPLNFSDVAHYVVVMHCQSGACGPGPIVSDVRPVVEAQVGRLR